MSQAGFNKINMLNKTTFGLLLGVIIWKMDHYTNNVSFLNIKSDTHIYNFINLHIIHVFMS